MKVAESKGRFEVVWSSLVSIFEDHSSWGCRKEAVSRCGLEVAARRQFCDQGMACGVSDLNLSI